MTILSIILSVYLFSVAIYAVLYCIQWINAIVLIKKYGCAEAGRVLVARGDKYRGTILTIMGFGDKWFKALTVIPIIGIVATMLILAWNIFKGTITIKMIIIITLFQVFLGWILGLLIKYGAKAILANKNN